MPDSVPPSGEKLPANTAGAIAAIVKIVTSLSTDRFLMVFVCAGFGFLMYKVMDAQTERETAQMRSGEGREEVARQEYANRLKETASSFERVTKEITAAYVQERKDHAKNELERDTARMKFEADERGKDRAMVQAHSEQFEKWRELLSGMLGKKLAPEPEENAAPVTAAPMPKAKGGSQ